MFRYKRSVPVSYNRQGYIYFTSRLFLELPEGRQREILALCRECGGEYAEALLEFVTTDKTAAEICMRHHLSRSTLERAVRKYYMRFLLQGKADGDMDYGSPRRASPSSG